MIKMGDPLQDKVGRRSKRIDNVGRTELRSVILLANENQLPLTKSQPQDKTKDLVIQDEIRQDVSRFTSTVHRYTVTKIYMKLTLRLRKFK